MKNFILGVVSAVIAAGLWWLIQSAIEDRNEDNKQRIAVAIDDDVVRIDKAQLDAISRKIDKYTTVTFATVETTNVGTDDIDNRLIHVNVPRLVAYGSMPVIGATTQNGSLKVRGDDVDLHYPLLSEGAKDRLWLAYTGYGDVSVSSGSPGLKVDAKSLDYPTIEFPIWEFVVGVVALIAGMTIYHYAVRAHLKQRGHDFDQMMKDPVVP